MTDPQIICTNCGTEIKLTKSLAAPIVAASRKEFEAQLAAKEADFGRREARLKQTQDDLAKARESHRRTGRGEAEDRTRRHRRRRGKEGASRAGG